jgi:hypothetical protein
MDNVNVLNELPPQDEYAAVSIPPPAYGSFEEVCARWRAADKAKQDITTIEKDCKVVEKDLKEAKEVLDSMKKKRYGSSESQTMTLLSIIF